MYPQPTVCGLRVNKIRPGRDLGNPGVSSMISYLQPYVQCDIGDIPAEAAYTSAGISQKSACLCDIPAELSLPSAGMSRLAPCFCDIAADNKTTPAGISHFRPY